MVSAPDSSCRSCTFVLVTGARAVTRQLRERTVPRGSCPGRRAVTIGGMVLLLWTSCTPASAATIGVHYCGRHVDETMGGETQLFASRGLRCAEPRAILESYWRRTRKSSVMRIRGYRCVVRAVDMDMKSMDCRRPRRRAVIRVVY